MRVQYLTGQVAALRPLTLADKDTAGRWHPSPYPLDSARAEEWLKETHKAGMWGRTMYYAIVRIDGAATPEASDDEIVGSVKVWTNGRHSQVNIHVAPFVEDAGAIRADVLTFVAPWLASEREMLTTTVEIVSDETEEIAAAEAIGMTQAVRLREHIARPGGWADLYFYQMINGNWRFENEETGNA